MRLLAAVVVAVALGGCAASPCEERPPLRVQLLLVNDVYRLDPDSDGRGGLARVATLVRQLRRETPHTLLALAGDTLSPSLLSSVFQGAQMIEAWNLLGLDAATFGNHEFDWGPAVLRERMRESRFQWVSSNVAERDTGAPFGGAAPWLRLDWGGVRVGVVGLTLPETAATSSPGPEVAFAPPLEAARAAFGRMGPVDLRVALTHLPMGQDRALAAALPLEVILGGHDHEPMLDAEGRTVIVKAGADAVNVGQVEYELGCGARVLSRRQRLIPVDARLAEAPDLAALTRRYAERLERELAVRVGITRVPLDAREWLIRRQANALGRYLAELMSERVGAEVGLLNSGAVRGNRLLLAGPLTRGDIHALLPFGNIVVLLEVSGAALQGALEHSVSALPAAAGRYLQTAGIEYEVNPARAAGARVSRVRVGGQPLEPGRAYRVATIEYLARGGDGYAMLAEARALLGAADGPALVDTVLQALREGRYP